MVERNDIQRARKQGVHFCEDIERSMVSLFILDRLLTLLCMVFFASTSLLIAFSHPQRASVDNCFES